MPDYLIVCRNAKVASRAFSDACEQVRKKGIKARVFTSDLCLIVGEPPDRFRCRYVTVEQSTHGALLGYRGRVVYYDENPPK